MDDIHKIRLIYIVIIVAIIWAIYLLIKRLIVENKKSHLAKNNQFVLENKEKIEEKINESAKELRFDKFKVIFLFMIFIVCVIMSIIMNQRAIPVVLSIISSIVLIIMYSQYSRSSEEKYVDTVIKTLRDYDSNLEYLPNGGFTKHEYKECFFPEQCDRFHSEDLITNSNKRFCFADILVESEHEDSDDHTYYVTEFQGSLARIDIKNMNCRIFLGSTSGKLFYGNDRHHNIKFENDEFNKLFRACSDNELQAYKLLTPDIMEEFVKIKKNAYGDIDIRIIYDKLYIRFLTGDTFDSTVFNKRREKRNLLKSIAVLEEVMKTMDNVKNIIENKNMD